MKKKKNQYGLRKIIESTKEAIKVNNHWLGSDDLVEDTWVPDPLMHEFLQSTNMKELLSLKMLSYKCIFNK